MRIALTIAGSDTCAGAGAQLDLRVFAALGVYGVSVLTSLTAQSTRGVERVCSVPPRFIGAQIDALARDLPIAAVKIGMLHRPQAVHAVAERLRRRELTHVVVDPVIVASDGTPLLAPRGVDALRKRLLPRATVVTPNIAEAEALSGVAIRGEDDLPRAAAAILELGVPAVLITGGHAPGDATDTLFTREGRQDFSGERIAGAPVHGTGCALSSAIAAHLALGEALPAACRLAKALVAQAIRDAQPLGKGARLITLGVAAAEAPR